MQLYWPFAIDDTFPAAAATACSARAMRRSHCASSASRIETRRKEAGWSTYVYVTRDNDGGPRNASRLNDIDTIMINWNHHLNEIFIGKKAKMMKRKRKREKKITRQWGLMMVFRLIFYGRAVALSGAVAAAAEAAMCRHTWRMGKGENWGPNNDELAVDNQSKGQVRYRQEESTISFNIPLLFTRERRGRETTTRYEKKKKCPRYSSSF